jgi:uncharacterized membrane protein
MLMHYLISNFHMGMATIFALLSLQLAPVVQAASSPNSIEVFFQTWTGYIADGVEAGAGVLIALAALQAIIRSLVLFFRSLNAPIKPTHPNTEDVRLRLGRWLALALEFELAADILRTAIAPSWSQIGQLAAIAAIRTALNYFLGKEIERAAVSQRFTTNAPGETSKAGANQPFPTMQTPEANNAQGQGNITNLKK